MAGQAKGKEESRESWGWRARKEVVGDAGSDIQGQTEEAGRTGVLRGGKRKEDEEGRP